MMVDISISGLMKVALYALYQPHIMVYLPEVYMMVDISTTYHGIST